jgi:hypothetical protein
MLDGEEIFTVSSVSSEKSERSYSPMSVPTDQTQPFEGRANSSTISGMTLHTSALSSANYYRAPTRAPSKVPQDKRVQE